MPSPVPPPPADLRAFAAAPWAVPLPDLAPRVTRASGTPFYVAPDLGRALGVLLAEGGVPSTTPPAELLAFARAALVDLVADLRRGRVFAAAGRALAAAEAALAADPGDDDAIFDRADVRDYLDSPRTRDAVESVRAHLAGSLERLLDVRAYRDDVIRAARDRLTADDLERVERGDVDAALARVFAIVHAAYDGRRVERRLLWAAYVAAGSPGALGRTTFYRRAETAFGALVHVHGVRYFDPSRRSANA